MELFSNCSYNEVMSIGLGMKLFNPHTHEQAVMFYYMCNVSQPESMGEHLGHSYPQNLSHAHCGVGDIF